MEDVGRYLIIVGICLALVGGAVYLAGRFGVPLGRLPGDIRIEHDSRGYYFPLATSILVSLILTVGLNILLRIFRK